MKPLPAVGLASSLVQIIDFSVKVLQKEYKIYQSADGDFIENPTLLQNAVDNLFRLLFQLENNDLKKLSADPKRGKLSEAAEHLLKLGDETKLLATPLIDAILQAQAKGSYGDPKWTTLREALLTVWKKKDVTGLKKKLRNVRKDVDTSLLLALKQYLNQSAETGLPVFSAEDASHVERWQNDAMDAVHTNDWKPKTKKDVEGFSKHVDLLVQVENQAHFYSQMFAKLYFPHMDDRLHTLSAAHEGTFDWIFDSNNDESKTIHCINLLDWLSDSSGQNLFWITGKPGSGKSTLMKSLLRNPRLFPSLESWSDSAPGIITGFFFWGSGTKLQKSVEGLLRSLLYEALQDMLYGPLEQDPILVQLLFPSRWNQFASYGGGMYPFTVPELRLSFDLMISDVTRKFFLLIDGLDELDDYPNDIIDLLLSATKRDNVKICASSRPSPGFQDAFQERPRLVVDQKTRKDIQAYVQQMFNKDERLSRLRQEQTKDALEQELVHTMAEKSSGVFLWAYLGTDSLLQAGDELDEESDGLKVVSTRLKGLPLDLNLLLTQIFETMGQDDLWQASRLCRLIDAHGYPGLLSLSFSNDVDTRSSLHADIRPLKDSEVTKRLDDMTDLLSTKCRNLFSVFETSGSESHDVGHLRVTYAHRCIRDFVHTRPVWSKICEATGNDSFSSDEYWANASLWSLKTLQARRTSHIEVLRIWDDLAWCIEYALRLEDHDKKVRVTYLDEVGRAAIIERRDQISVMDLPQGVTVESFLDIAVWLNLQGYVAIKAKSAERKEIKHAMEYSKALRRQLGISGEVFWIGEKKRIKSAYGQSALELGQLLEYYAKPVKFATSKPKFEIPEHE
ncbi:hypothetical protein BDV95DRAFT_590592 [Massariosphaeria phaeospora]|uniref:NACHT domain-containing protein n=1 Tax=Massariosphaeria phaeospora TaxID=100035 RepID=A0A7C8MGS0_9PLEO|nr:hypothetical protein BDV95DRAFT_590592 [Massariosphaeria phaeospora]